MSVSSSKLKIEKENSFICLSFLLDFRNNKAKTFKEIVNNFRKFTTVPIIKNIFNYHIENIILSDEFKKEDDLYFIFKALKIYFLLNSCNSKFLLKKMEIIYDLLNLLTKISNDLKRIFDSKENQKIFKKIIKFFYDLYVILSQLNENNNLPNKDLNYSIKLLEGFFTKLKIYKKDYKENNYSVLFIDKIILSLPDEKFDKLNLISYDEIKLDNIYTENKSKKNNISENNFNNTPNLLNIQNNIDNTMNNKNNLNGFNLKYKKSDISNEKEDLKNNSIKNNLNFNNNKIILNQKNLVKDDISKYENLDTGKNKINRNTNEKINNFNINDFSVNSNESKSNESFSSNKNFKQKDFETKNESVIYHKQNNKLTENTSFDKNLISPKIDMKIFTTKFVNYTNIYFEKEVFLKDFSFSKGIVIKDFYQCLNRISTELYENNLSYSKMEKIDEKNFQNLIKQIFPSNKPKFIGSYDLKYYTNLKDKNNSINILIDANFDKINSQDIISNKVSILKKLNNLKTNEFYLEIKNEENLSKNNSLTLLVKSNNLDTISIVDLIFYNQKYDISHKFLVEIFKPNPDEIMKDNESNGRSEIIENIDLNKLYKLHIFFQEILLDKINIFLSSRFELSVLILSFLDYEYSILNKKNKFEMNLTIPDFNHNIQRDSQELKVKVTKIYIYKLKTNNFKNIFKDKQVGELINDFFRYVLNYLTYFKNIHYDRGVGNAPRDKCVGFDNLKKRFSEVDQPLLYDPDYLFNHLDITAPIKSLNQGEYNTKFIKSLNLLSNIYFKILENHKDIKNYAEIIYNIGKNLKRY